MIMFCFKGCSLSQLIISVLQYIIYISVSCFSSHMASGILESLDVDMFQFNICYVFYSYLKPHHFKTSTIYIYGIGIGQLEVSK